MRSDTASIARTQEELQDVVNRLVHTGRKYGMGNKYQQITCNESIQEKLLIVD